MDAVFGVGPLARALASALGTSGTVLHVGPEVVRGPFFWRRGDLTTGEGVTSALKDARRAFLVLDAATDVRTFFTLLKPRAVARGVVVLPLDGDEPKDLRQHPDWSVVRVAPAWGPEEPLVAAWARALVAGHRPWVADPGPVRPVALPDAIAAIRAAAGFRGLRWSVIGPETVRLPDLATALAAGLGVAGRTITVPLRLAAWRAGVPEERLIAWTRAPEAAWHTPGWSPPELRGREAWLGPPEVWRPAAGLSPPV